VKLSYLEKSDEDQWAAINQLSHCLTHEVKLSYLEKSDEDQWAAINQLRRLVYSGIGIVGASSFFGAIIGNLLAGFYKR
jgi:hypothetical protein